MKVTTATRQLGYLISYKSILGNLQNEVKNLLDERQRVEENLTWDSEVFQTQISWLRRVDDNVGQVNAFSNYYEGKSTCSNLLWRYRVGKQARKMTQAISKLHEEYQSVMLTKDYKGPKSRTDTINEIMIALKDPLIQIIGVWGLDGRGTTSLAKQVGEQGKEQNLFGAVVMTTLTEKPNVEQIQGHIAATLGLHFDGETHMERRNRLRQRIKEEKNILIIVGTSGELNAQEIDFEEFGVPFEDECEGCKILLTSKNLDFIKNLKGNPKVFQLEVLPEDEALSLFEKTVGGVVPNSEESFIVKEIVKICAGSALSTYVVAKSLRNKGLGAWQDALMQMKDNVSPIKICYNSLENEEHKYFLLLLAIRGKRYIPKYCIYIDMWAGLFKNLNTLEDVKNRVDSLINDLKAYGLVVVERKDWVKIVDLIWETVYSIVQRDLGASIISGKLPPEEWLRSLRFCNITIWNGLQIPERLQCPQLQEIVLNTSSPSMQVPDSFFEETTLLKVLDFVGFNCSKLPISIGLLKNLQALSLYSCKLEDISIIGELTNLRMLGLLESHIQQLPRQIGQLRKLVFLDLRYTYLQVIPPNVLSNLTSLEELYLRNSFCNWEVEGFKTGNTNASLKELRNLHHLVHVEDLYVPDHLAWPVDFCFETHKSYAILIGDTWDQSQDSDQGLKTLKLKLSRKFQSEDGIKKMLKNANVLYLDELNGPQNVLSDLDSDGFPQLQSLIVQHNAEIKYITLSTSHPLDAFPNLESLSLNNLSNIKHICHGPLTEKSFFKIRVIKVHKCNGMTSLFSNSMIKGLPHLADIEISECWHIMAIVVEDGETPRIEFPQLRSLTLRELPALTSFLTEPFSHIYSLFHDKVSFPNLETVMIFGAPQLSTIWDYVDQNSFWKIKNVNITDCGRLRYIFDNFIPKKFPNLKTLSVRNCGSVECIFPVKLQDQPQRISLQLIHIKLVHLPSLMYVCEAPQEVQIEFSEMSRMHLEYLPRFKGLALTSGVELPFLSNVVVYHCPNIKKFGLGRIEKSQLKDVIIDNQVDIDTKVAHLFELPDRFSTMAEYNIDDNEELRKALDNSKPSHFTKLTWLRAKNCNERLNEFLSILMSRSNLLEYLIVEHCNSLQCLFKELPDFSSHRKLKYLPLLKELMLIELPQLNCIWDMDLQKFCLSNLQKIHIKSCPCLQHLITSTAVEELHQLNELKIEACEMLMEVVSSENEYVEIKPKHLTQPLKFTVRKVELVSLSSLIMVHSDNYALEYPRLKSLTIEDCPKLEAFTTGFATVDELSTTDGKSFSELNELKLDSCGKLIHVISSNTLQELGNLKKLTVSHCIKLKSIFKIQGEMSRSTKSLPLQKLSELTLTNLPNLIYIINNESTRLYQNLLILRVKLCKSLSCLAGSLMLTYMEILDCEALEKITIMDKKEETGGKILFPQLKYVSLENLTKLSTLFPFTSELPSLETLIIANCPALMTFVEESDELKDPSTPIISNYFFPISLSLEKLKVLQLRNQNVEKLWHYNCPPKSFCELENMNLSGNNKLSSVISSSMMIRYNNLNILTVHNCELLTKVFILEDEKPDQNIEHMLPQLRVLVLSSLSGLTQIWNKEPQVPFFQNLMSLHIVLCDNLKSIFSVSACKYLRQLKLFKLYNCEEMNEIISGNEDENVSITFPEVECLILKDLPNLTCFCPQSGTFNWPKLQTLRVSNIPHMETFVKGHLNTPLLKTVYTTFVEKCWRGNLNKTISYLHKNTGKKGLSRLSSQKMINE